MQTHDLFDNNITNSVSEVLNAYSSPVCQGELSVLDLFCGCGGLSLGFQRAGYRILGGIDNDSQALETYAHNLNAPALNLDLSSEDWTDRFLDHIETDSVDIIIGGPPCQGFSLTGTRIADDPRNKLYNAIFRAIDRFNPKAILIENVRGMATLYGGRAKQQVLEEFYQRNFKVDWGVLNAAHFGVPQNRHRLFFLATNEGISLPRPVLSEKSFVTCGQAIGDLPSLGTDGYEFTPTRHDSPPKTAYQLLMRAGNTSKLYNHEPTRHKKFVVDTIKLVPEGGNHKDLPPGVGESRKFNEAWTRYHRDKPSRTIDTGHRNHFHYEEHRVPTVRENARLQSFPDDFEVLGTKTAQNRQIGNAVPVLLSQAIANQIYAGLKN